jgi:6-phosphofructokinase 1
MRSSHPFTIGILTAGGDCPGLNAAIRALVRAADGRGWRCLGVTDGFRGLVTKSWRDVRREDVAGILATGGTILGTSRDKPHRFPLGDKLRDMTGVMVRNAKKAGIEVLVCLGGGGTQKNAHRLSLAGLPCVTLPKTIDNDIAGTDACFGYDTAVGIAAEALDRLHSTATSHHRVIVCEVMGHRAGWLALGAGLASGTDVILLPEIPYDLQVLGGFLNRRRREGRRFSLVCLAEGAPILGELAPFGASGRLPALEAVLPATEADEETVTRVDSEPERQVVIDDQLLRYHAVQESKASRLARVLQALTGMEARVAQLGHIQRGGAPSPADRNLATRLGTAAVAVIAEGGRDCLIAARGDGWTAVPLDQVAGHTRLVPLDHPLLTSGRDLGVCFGDR